MLPRVLIIYTGGTFGMDLLRHPQKGSLVLTVPQLSPESLKKKLSKRVPELQDIAHCDVDILLNRDSAHMGPGEWILIANKIRENWKKYDGFVIIHGTDTLAYTACALSFLLRPCLKPVVITGAQRPLSALRTDARTNLISSVEIAARGPKKIVNQVTVFFGDQLYQGNRVRKKSTTHFSAFESPHYAPLAMVGTTIRYTDSPQPKVPSKKEKITLIPSFDARVLVAHVTPSFPAEVFTESLLSHLDALILIVFHSGTAPTHDPSFLAFLERAKKKKLPIIVATNGSTQPMLSEPQSISYAAGKELLSKGCFSAGSMTPECTFVKTSYLLAQSKNMKTFSRLWKQELAAEGS